jgi:hypothetical protein
MSDDAKKPPQEEEISLSGKANPQKAPEEADVAAGDAPDVDMSQRDGNLASEITDGMTNSDIVDAILQTSPDQLIPWEEVTLPSKGLYYGWTSGTIRVRAWSANIDKILATQRLAATGQAFDKMIASCCQFPDGFTPQDLLVGDQVFLMYYLRGITHGNLYEFAVSTPSKNSMTVSFDLNDLAQTIVWGDESLGPEPFRS